MTVQVRQAVAAEVADLADVAAATFPLACPPSAAPENIAEFIAHNLSADRFAEYLRDPERAVFVAHADGRILGYTMLIRGVPDDPDVQRAVPERPAVELSKCYVLPDVHGGQVAATLMTASLDHAGELGARCVWLGVNQENQRAQRFYRKHGFEVSGTKTFQLGARTESDYVPVRPL
ncbi:GNAT family N-acetyltransferase [Mycobacterium sp. CBMA293]|uniref:GNAT family N-acetyltransferase n=1 Tax=unclassified Mycolicibacterium TaxID=2636767 RepID=UPI0012DF6B1D|nr:MULTISPECIES: GNAT family N-acetyltransferase [unclassified Mycolicibacterium]MUL44797.1 GNAT family N-acetyltransferase [Mycolicibacterium sp. CBMA 360]MUL58094.1 GNAT family N-acetyltransferase [Mycolicibacterium sp. CBMA 335]MUL73552.1 GNAT family N-acetyltransferase [Mycolicibacterium sp. CBMA 311]MUL95390.1 GNAT family N-acetyltransferase [Mycolicibacterium sp. CBMA 230]MUM07526.1 GNAT family N-acetyltransferase [Mycolicibacterium sp. CBMA 213]